MNRTHAHIHTQYSEHVWVRQHSCLTILPRNENKIIIIFFVLCVCVYTFFYFFFESAPSSFLNLHFPFFIFCLCESNQSEQKYRQRNKWNIYSKTIIIDRKHSDNYNKKHETIEILSFRLKYFQTTNELMGNLLTDDPNLDGFMGFDIQNM